MDAEDGNVESPLPKRRRWWRDVVLGILLFACGVVVGGAAVSRFHAHRMLSVSQNGIDRERMYHRLQRALDLNEEQAAKVRAIVGKGLDDLRAVRLRMRPEVEAALEGVRDEVAAVLDDTQKQKWESRFDQIRERWLPPLTGNEPAVTDAAPGAK